jgi:hypothetical protein
MSLFIRIFLVLRCVMCCYLIVSCLNHLFFMLAVLLELYFLLILKVPNDLSFVKFFIIMGLIFYVFLLK